MAPEIHSHAVYGFSESLDWTTLHFVKLIDDIRVCSACRAVARKTAFLACRHVLCEPCYEHWKSRGSHVCFLDGDLCPENEVHWMEFPVEKMMKYEVSCSNRDNGCEVITDVSSITDHFHRDCEHHSVCCPKCSSAVLRKDIIAHLESQCVNHVLRVKPTPPPREGEHKDLQGFREGVRGTEMAFRNASLKDASLVTSLQGLTAKDEEYVDSLSKMAVEVVQMSEVTRQTLSAVERSRERHMNQIADLKTCKESLCAEVDEIKSAANEFGCCEAADQQEMREHEECAEKLQALKAEILSLSSMLRELRNKFHLEVAVAEIASADGLYEVLSCHHFSFRKNVPSNEKFPLEATTRAFENEREVPAKVLWCVYGWTVLRHDIKERNFICAVTSITFDGRYEMRLIIHQHCKYNQLITIKVLLRERDGATLDVAPKNVTLFFINRKKHVAENKMTLKKSEYWGEKWAFETGALNVKELERSGIVQGNVFKVCFTFLY